MSGPKAYTMREMKAIVEYLVEHKAYGELKGRKMWMDFSNSPLTTRTWQSLKETFLKRILPDIQNPYYHLTRDQVCSFRQGFDVAEKEKKNRLEIQRSSEERSNDAGKQKNTEQRLVTQTASSSAEKSNEVDKTAGEDFQSEKISARNRSSAETFILDDDKRQSHDNSTEERVADSEVPPKTMRDCLGFEESETPSVVRAVLEDFGTDSEESDAAPMEIVDNTNKDNNKNNDQDVEDSENVEIIENESILVEGGKTDSEDSDAAPMEIVESTNKYANKNNDEDLTILEESENAAIIENEPVIVEGRKEVDEGPTFVPENVTKLTSKDLDNRLKECTEEGIAIQTENNDERNTEQETSNTSNVSNEETVVTDDSEPIVIENTEESSENLNNNEKFVENNTNNQNSLTATNDTIIPNNQELLHAEVNKTNGISNEASPKQLVTRKCSSSQEHSGNKKAKLNEPVKTNGNIEITPPSSNNTEDLIEAFKNAETTVNNKQNTQNASDIEESHKNPCLKSVSLFEEQFNTTKYTDSEDEDTPIAKNDVKLPEKSIVNNNVSNKPNQDVEIVETMTTPIQNQKTLVESQDKNTVKDPEQEGPEDEKEEVMIIEPSIDQTTQKTRKNKNVVVLYSNSDSEGVEQVTERHKERYKRLSQAFGFVPGTSRTAHRRRSFHNRRARMRTISRGQLENSDGDASYTDLSDAEAFVSPPQGRRNRRGRLYRKPESGRIVSLEEEGRLFVILGNKVFPLVSDGNDLNYVHYDGSDNEEETTWRQKYIDQKKKAAELKKQIEQVKLKASSSRHKSPVPSSTNLRNGDGAQKSFSATPHIMDSKMNIVQSDTGKIQITLSNNNEEKINLEGHWPQVLPIMQQVMNMFYKPDIAVNENTKVDGTIPSAQQKEDISGRSTPIIPVVDLAAAREVEELERKIFQEIAERGNFTENDIPEKSINITKRRARTPSNMSEKSVKPAKIPRKSKPSIDAKSETKQTDDKTQIAKPKTQGNTRKNSECLTISDTLSVASKERSPSKDLDTKTPSQSAKKIEAIDQSELKGRDEKMGDKDVNKTAKTYKVSPIEPRVTRSRKSGNETDTSTQSRAKRTKSKASSDDEEVRYMLPPGPKSRKTTTKMTPNKAGSPENPHEISQDRFGNSIDSTQGYQDSDASPMKTSITRRKKKLGIVIKKSKQFRRKSFPSVTVDDISVDSSNSSYFVPKKSSSQPPLDSEIYKTESYEILMGRRNLSVAKLEAIDETSKSDDVGHFNAVSKTSNDSIIIEIGTGSSSLVSLPFSPELSVVENLSVSREMIQNISHPTINEQQANDSVVSNIYNQYLIADVDVSVPILQQDCKFHDTPKKNTTKKAKKPKAPAKSPIKVSTLLNKVSSVNMSVNNTLSDTLDQKLRDLLLESTKKVTNTTKDNLMQVDEPVETNKRGKKRCSTPRKRITKKSKATVGPVIDEHKESCAKDGRQSCPPLTTFVPMDENANNSADMQLKPNKPIKVKKDIIKVKIQRPTKAKEVTECNTSQASLYTDSGINESVSINGLLHGNDNVELIHNHSETCLQAHECIGNSVEFVEESKSSVISLHSTESLQSELSDVMKYKEKLSEFKSLSVVGSEEKFSEEIFATPATTVFHSPIAHPTLNNSLITEDLTDEEPSPPRKWYLLSEEITNSSHDFKPEQMTSNMRSSNYLKQIFPIACAVPDLSTISEMSKENEDSRKTLGEDTRSGGFPN